MLILQLLFMLYVTSGSSDAMTFAEKYEIWSADLPTGYKIVTNFVDGQRCHCKVPDITTVTTTTTTPESTTTTTATTTTPKSTTTSTATTTTPESTTTTPVTTTTTTTPVTTTTTTTPATTTTTPATTTSTTTPASTTTTTTPATTTTTTSTTTTTPATTTSTSTSTTTTPPTTTSSTTTTTSTPATTTTSTTTTTVAAVDSGPCGACNKTITVNFATYQAYGEHTEYWSSPNYPSNYPDGCVCVLNINLLERGFVLVSFNSGDAIHTATNCAYDNLIMTGDNTYQNPICDNNIDQVTDFIVKNQNDGTTQQLVAVFTSDPGDGNIVDKGFQMTISIQIYENRALNVPKISSVEGHIHAQV
ncbi:uncharacterized protein [Macrobrachium rosenbergii]|uniref:uncharacterized protein n=1 Tax=Macrobrachium rosenbergii TaxID=79674 RepID=UPI0034D3EBC8